MPATPVNPLAAILVQSALDELDTNTFTLLQDEEFLLIHSCKRSGKRDKWMRHNRDGHLIAYVRYNPALTYSVQASVLNVEGEHLGNYHPGRALSDRALAFANGGMSPFQFADKVNGVTMGKLFYSDPEADPVPGDPTAISFTVEHLFLDLDTERYPTQTPPTQYAEVPLQALSGFVAANAKNLMLKDYFKGEANISGGAFKMVCYNGDPAVPGSVAVTALITATAWTNITYTVVSSAVTARNPLMEWAPANVLTSGLPVTHIMVARGANDTAYIELDTPLTVPVGAGIRVPAGMIAIDFRWYLDGQSIPLADHPAYRGLLYLLGGAALPAGDLTLQAWAADPALGGSPLETWTVARGGLWTVTGDTAAPTGTLNSDTNAPGGGWAGTYLAVVFDGKRIASENNAWSATVGNPVAVNAANLTLNLDDA